jgi:peptidoglycan/LPS O-acetylase OafA/YrhL
MIMTAVCSAWILVAVLTDPKSRLAKVLQLRPVIYLGRISYGYYLWHFPIALCLGWFRMGIYIRAALTIAIAVSVAAVSYHWLELPARRLRVKPDT